MTAEGDILKYKKSIKQLLAHIWLDKEEEVSAYLSKTDSFLIPGNVPVDKVMKRRATTKLSKKWSKFLCDCFNKVSFCSSFWLFASFP